jgi:hypothetical protein
VLSVGMLTDFFKCNCSVTQSQPSTGNIRERAENLPFGLIGCAPWRLEYLHSDPRFFDLLRQVDPPEALPDDQTLKKGGMPLRVR